MAVIIEMPKLSDTMTTGTLVRWLKKEGASVESGDLIAEVQTDKAIMDVEAFEAGILLKHYALEGTQVAIGAPMCAIGKPGEALPEVNKTIQAPPVAVATVAVAVAPVLVEGPKRLRASPLAKKLARQHGVVLEWLQGSGPGGRIVKVDVLAAVAPLSVPVKALGYQEALTPMRATIARRLLESKTQIPHFYLDLSVDAQPLMQLRQQLNANCADGAVKFTVNDLLLKATAMALMQEPAVNASWKGDHLWHPQAVHLSFAVALEKGLVTPVIPDAHTKSLKQIALEAKALIDKARSHRLGPKDMSGSTFTLSNLGNYGIESFFGIINPPNAAILSIGSIVSLPVVDADGQVVAGQRLRLGLSADHRVVDGGQAAMFLKALKELLEKPLRLLV